MNNKKTITNLLTNKYKIEESKFEKFKPLLEDARVTRLFFSLATGLGYMFKYVQEDDIHHKMLVYNFTRLTEVFIKNPKAAYDDPKIRQIIVLEEVPLVGELLVLMLKMHPEI